MTTTKRADRLRMQWLLLASSLFVVAMVAAAAAADSTEFTLNDAAPLSPISLKVQEIAVVADAQERHQDEQGGRLHLEALKLHNQVCPCVYTSVTLCVHYCS